MRGRRTYAFSFRKSAVVGIDKMGAAAPLPPQIALAR